MNANTAADLAQQRLMEHPFYQNAINHIIQNAPTNLDGQIRVVREAFDMLELDAPDEKTLKEYMEALWKAANGSATGHVQTLSHEHVGPGTTQMSMVEEEPAPPPQSETIPIYEVDTYQISVPNGDCSIHLLVERTHLNNGCRGVIKRSILMDGGDDGLGRTKYSPSIIENALAQIKTSYLQDLDNGQGPSEIVGAIRFDAWVVTHWDHDHWGGTLGMIQADLLARGGRMSKYMKYNQDGDPLTTLYCPNWSMLPRLIENLVPLEKQKIKTKPADLFITPLDIAETLGQGRVNVIVRGAQPTIRENVFIAKWGPRMLLGRDFFSGHCCWASAPGANESVTFDNALAEWFPKFNTLAEVTKTTYGNIEQPRFFCIGAAGFLLGTKMTNGSLNASYGDMGYTKHKVEGKDEGTTYTALDTWGNYSSIVSVLHFPETNIPPTPPKRRISLYWAGDATATMEETLVNSGFFQGYRFGVTKWSHHGSRHSNPPKLWETFKPDKCVVSANKTGQYLHPNPSVITNFMNYCNDHNLLPDFRVFSTHFPGYLSRMRKNAAKFGPSSVSDEMLGIWSAWGQLSPVQWDRVVDKNTHMFEPDYKNIRGHFVTNSNGSPPGSRVAYLLIVSSAEVYRDGVVHLYVKGPKSGWRAIHNGRREGKMDWPNSAPPDAPNQETPWEKEAIPIEHLQAFAPQKYTGQFLADTDPWLAAREIVATGFIKGEVNAAFEPRQDVNPVQEAKRVEYGYDQNDALPYDLGDSDNDSDIEHEAQEHNYQIGTIDGQVHVYNLQDDGYPDQQDLSQGSVLITSPYLNENGYVQRSAYPNNY